MIVKNIKEAVINLHEKFKENHNEKNGNSKIKIGRSRSLSNYFERQIALALKKEYANYNYIYLVDYPLTMKDNKIIYQDILVIDQLTTDNKGNAKALIDLKIDLGFIDENYYEINNKKKIKKSFSEREKLIEETEEIKFNKIVGPTTTEEVKENKIKYKVNLDYNSIKKIAIVCTKQNKEKQIIDSYEKKLQEEGYKVIFLLDDIHPNTTNNITEKIKDEINSKSNNIEDIIKI